MPFSDIVAVSGLLLTLTTFLFNLAWPRLTEAMALDQFQSGVQARKRSRETVVGTLFSCALPLTCAFAALFYVNLPAAVGIVRTSTLDFWDFDTSRTLFVLMTCALFAFVAVNVWLCVRLVEKWRSLL
ncbi:hypothetical protein ACREYJ_27870 [Pseudomonas kribbensis]|uniref:hypothetical protein n=1 Tax=Pseudomonas kribbensis TaxID=1628086 RepID=UPI003D774382